MIIAVNTRLLLGNIHGGIEWFTYEILSRIVRAHPEHIFLFIFDRPFDKKFIFGENVKPVIAGTRAVHPILWRRWNQVSIPKALRENGADIYLSPDGTIPLGLDTPCLPVIHDISFVHRPKDIPLHMSRFYRTRFPEFARAAKRIITVSEFSANDISRTWGIDRGKIDIVYNGVSDEFFNDPGPQIQVVPEIGQNRSYFLFVGNLSPRKNVPTMIRAFNKFRETDPDKYKFVIAGERFFLNSETDRQYKESPYRDDIIFTGAMNREQLRRLYSNSCALLFTPWFEGFGIPVIEAMKCGTPVICSDTSSLPEVSGGASILVSPDNIEQISAAMSRVKNDTSLRQNIINKGYENAGRFSWDNAAKSLWLSLEKTIKIE